MRSLITCLALAICVTTPLPYLLAQSASFDIQLQTAAKLLSEQMEAGSRKKLAILDITELDGRSSEFGKFISEQLTVELIGSKHTFVLIDQANREKIIAQMRESNTGLVRTEDVKKLGQLSGADTILLGKITEVGGNAYVTFTLSATDSGELIGGARMTFPMSENDRVLLQRGQVSASGAAGPQAASNKQFTSKSTKCIDGSLTFELTGFKINEAREIIVTIETTNTSKQVGYGLGIDFQRYSNGDVLRTSVIDSGGANFGCTDYQGLNTDPDKSYICAVWFSESVRKGFKDQLSPQSFPALKAGATTNITLRFIPWKDSSVNATLDYSFNLKATILAFQLGTPRITKFEKCELEFENIRPRR